MLGSRFKFVGTVLAISSMLSTSVLAYLPPINFDGSEYVSLTLVHHESGGQYAGWELVDGTAQVSASGDGYNGGKALEIPASAEDPAHLRREIPWSPTEEIAFIDFRTKPSTNPVGSDAGFYANGAQFAFQKSPDGLTGEVWVYDGNDGSQDPANDPEEWLQTAAGFNLNSTKTAADQYMRVTLRQDTRRDIWDLFVTRRIDVVRECRIDVGSLRADFHAVVV